jgi:hypothetical protein
MPFGKVFIEERNNTCNDKAIGQLLEIGGGIRQITRLTSIGKNIVEKISKRIT